MTPPTLKHFQQMFELPLYGSLNLNNLNALIKHTFRVQYPICTKYTALTDEKNLSHQCVTSYVTASHFSRSVEYLDSAGSCEGAVIVSQLV